MTVSYVGLPCYNEEKDINLTFPEDYMSEELKGQKVVFKVKVNEVKTRVVPKLDKDFFDDLAMDDVHDEKSLRKHIKEHIAAEKEVEELKIEIKKCNEEIKKKKPLRIHNPL